MHRIDAKDDTRDNNSHGCMVAVGTGCGRDPERLRRMVVLQVTGVGRSRRTLRARVESRRVVEVVVTWLDPDTQWDGPGSEQPFRAPFESRKWMVVMVVHGGTAATSAVHWRELND